MVGILSLFGTSVWAQSDFDYAVDNENQAVSDNSAYAGTQDLGDIIRVIIRGALGADELDRDHARRNYRGKVTCYAENRRGRTFSSDGNRPRRVQEKALNRCERQSNRRCRPLGCRTDRWG